MQPVSLKTQRVIMLIPLLNVANLYLCVYNLNVIPLARKNVFRALGYVLVYTVPAWFVWSVLYQVVSGGIPALELLISAAGYYLVPMMMSYGLIQFQKKYVFESQKKKEGKPL